MLQVVQQLHPVALDATIKTNEITVIDPVEGAMIDMRMFREDLAVVVENVITGREMMTDIDREMVVVVAREMREMRDELLNNQDVHWTAERLKKVDVRGRWSGCVAIAAGG